MDDVSNDLFVNSLDSLELAPNEATSASGEKSKTGYYDRKLEGRLRKYETYLKKNENINRVNNLSQVSKLSNSYMFWVKDSLLWFKSKLLFSFYSWEMVVSRTTYPHRFWKKHSASSEM